MIHRFLSTALLLAGTLPVLAQQITYNHDPMKQNQITVMESGTGTLTPAWYYNSLHDSYARSAAQKSKTSLRALSATHLYNQRDYAEAIDSALTRRAAIEALNVADRSGGNADLAWATEGSKVTHQMTAFMANINRVIPTGGSNAERDYWLQYYNVYQCAIRNTQDAYMPNAQRKREYLRIYADVSQKNGLLVKYLIRLNNKQRIQARLSAMADTCQADKPSITSMALARWQAAVGMTCGHVIEE